MQKKCKKISLGKISKYLLLVIFASIFLTCLYYLKLESKFFAKNNDSHPVVYNTIYSLGLCLSVSLFLITKLCNKSKNKKSSNNSDQNYKIYSIDYQAKAKEVYRREKYLWILLVSIIDFISNMLANFFWHDQDCHFCSWVINIFILTLLSRLILKFELQNIID